MPAGSATFGLAQQDRRRAASPGQPDGGAGELPGLPRDPRTPGASRPGQCRLAARPVGLARQDRRCAGRQGNLTAALESYQASLAIRERLARADPGNAGWQRDLSVSHEKIGDVLRAQGNLTAALESYQASLAIAERLARRRPGQCRLAARPVGVARKDRRCAAWPGQPDGGAGDLPGRTRDRNGWREPTRAMPAGSATCRSRTT